MNAIFTGRKRSGKTTLAFDFAMSRGGGVIVFDPKREFRGWPGEVTDVSQIEAKIKEDHSVIVFHPEGDTKESFSSLADYVLELHKVALQKNWDKSGYHFTFLVDEAINVSMQHWIDEKLLQLVAQNRPEILDIYLTFQSPKDSNNLLKSRVDNWFIFNTSLPSDLDYLNKEVGVPEYDLREIQSLRPHEYAHFFFDGGEPQVTYEYEPELWFRPLEYFELNEQERGEEMARNRDREDLEDLIDGLNDIYKRMFDSDDDDDRIRRRRDDRDDRDDRGRGNRRREFQMFDRGRR